ncbi:MAG: hypothetical protein LC632_06470 [Xanthomonadaceae bacterium]|nr:hypothetical protein [Xanthomonadaceae bacterium]
MKRTTLLLALLLSAAPAAAEPVTVSGDIRAGWLSSETRNRAGALSDTDSLRARARVRATYGTGDWQFAARFAAVLDSRQDDTGFWFQPYAPSPTGLRQGDATLDELYAEYGFRDAWTLRAGRFQTRFELEGVAPKSLDRNDSPNLDVTWTDGLWLRHSGPAWTAHFVAQHNHHEGPTNVQRQPLWFGEGDARATLFAALEAAEPLGPVVQRVVAVTWAPNALRPLGVANPARADYLAVTFRGAAAWPVGAAGMRILVGAEAGYAPNTPRRVVMGTGTNGDAGGLAWQLSLNLLDFAPNHSLGLVAGRVDDGWLISSDFRPNESLLELRWAWRLHSSWVLHARIRRREELAVPFAPLLPRRTDDAYLRATYRF